MIYITLPENFPSVPPRLRIDPNLNHSLADEQGTLHVHELKHWTGTSDIGKVIAFISHSFHKNPPQPKLVARNSTSSSLLNPSHNPHPMPPPMPTSYSEITLPPLPHAPNLLQEQESVVDLDSLKINPPKEIWEIPLVKQLTESQMKELINDENAMRDFAFQTAEGIRDMKNSSQEGLLDTASTNVKKTQEIDTMEIESKTLRAEVNELTQKFMELQEQQQKVLRNYAPPRLLVEFEKALNKIDEQCDEVRKKFQEKEMTEIQFVKSYTELRNMYHLLGAKKEKFASFYG